MKNVIATMGIIATLGMVSIPSIAGETVGNSSSPQSSLPARKLDMALNPRLKQDSKLGVEQQRQKLDELRQSVNRDVNTGMEKVRLAITELNDAKPEEALKLLKEAVGSFDIALAANPSLGLTPVSSVVEVHELYTDPAAVQKQVAFAKTLLDSGNVQAARAALIPLRSDLAETVTYLPMATYPAAIRLGVKQITDGHIDSAKETLAAATNTLVMANRRIVPIPVLAARELVDEASKMDKAKKDDINQKLSQAKSQLQLAHLLGYRMDSFPDYLQIQTDIEKLQAEIRGQNRVEKLYKDLNTRLSSWVDAMTNKTQELARRALP